MMHGSTSLKKNRHCSSSKGPFVVLGAAKPLCGCYDHVKPNI